MRVRIKGRLITLRDNCVAWTLTEGHSRSTWVSDSSRRYATDGKPKCTWHDTLHVRDQDIEIRSEIVYLIYRCVINMHINPDAREAESELQAITGFAKPNGRRAELPRRFIRMRSEFLVDPFDLTPLRPAKKKEISHAPSDDIRELTILILDIWLVYVFLMWIPKRELTVHADLCTVIGERRESILYLLR